METESSIAAAPIVLPRARRLNFPALVCVIFFVVSGGAYGLEPLVGAVNAGWAVALVVVTPLVWSLPIALMVSELSSAMPVEGGYYVWVREGLGDFCGVQEGFWTICYTAVDMAIYPVLFVNYLAYFYPALALDENSSAAWPAMLWRWLIAVTLIAAAFLINCRGAHAVGRNAMFTTGLVLLPFAALVVYGFSQKGAATATANAVTHGLANKSSAGLLALGISTVLWNYCGWDNVSTFAGEVNDAGRNYPRALLCALPLTVMAYLLPLLAGIAVTVDASVWNESAGWPVIAQLIGGRWLGFLVAAAALVSAWSLFNSQLLYVSRLPYAMAQDGWLPAAFSKISTRTGVPIVALAASCIVSSLFAALPFGKLVVIDILLYSSALLLEFLALIALRRARPEMERGFRVPGGWFGLIFVTLAPMSCAAVVVAASLYADDAEARQTYIVALLIFSGTLLYLIRRKHANKMRLNI